MPSARSPKPGAMMAPGLTDHLLDDRRLGRDEQRGDGRRALQRRAGDLERVDHTLVEHVAVFAGERVEAVPERQVFDDLHDVVALETGVERDPAQRFGQRPAHHLGADPLVARQVQIGQRAVRLRERGATARDDARLQRGPRRGQRVLDPQHPFLELHAGGAADADHRDPAGQPGDAQLEAVPVSVDPGPFELRLELSHASVDESLLAVRPDDRRLVLGDSDAVAGPEVLQRDLGQLDTGVLGDHVATQRNREVFQFGDPAVTEAGSAHDDRLHGLVHVAADQQLQGRAVDILGEHDQRPVGALGHLDGRHDLLHLR